MGFFNFRRKKSDDKKSDDVGGPAHPNVPKKKPKTLSNPPMPV